MLTQIYPYLVRMDQTEKGFMCAIDFQHEVGHALGGNRVYPSIEDLKDNHPCWKECGIVEVEVKLVRWVEPQRLGEENGKAGDT